MCFQTSKSRDEQISLKEYLHRTKEGQKCIYYAAGDNIEVMSSFPFLDKLRKKGLEVLYMTDPNDVRAVQQLKVIEGKKFQLITKGGLDIEDHFDDELLKWGKAVSALRL